VGEGLSFKEKTITLQSNTKASFSAFVDVSQKEHIINTTSNTEVDIRKK
jgi:hypothetical protein